MTSLALRARCYPVIARQMVLGTLLGAVIIVAAINLFATLAGASPMVSIIATLTWILLAMLALASLALVLILPFPTMEHALAIGNRGLPPAQPGDDDLTHIRRAAINSGVTVVALMLSAAGMAALGTYWRTIANVDALSPLFFDYAFFDMAFGMTGLGFFVGALFWVWAYRSTVGVASRMSNLLRADTHAHSSEDSRLSS